MTNNAYYLSGIQYFSMCHSQSMRTLLHYYHGDVLKTHSKNAVSSGAIDKNLIKLHTMPIKYKMLKK